MTTDTLWRLAPEMMLAGAAVAIYVAGAFVAARGRWAWIAAASVVAVGTVLAVQHSSGATGPLSGDALAGFGRWFALLAALGLVLVVARRRLAAEPEYIGSLLLAVVGLMLLAAADELVLLFVSLELISIPTYILLYVDRRGGPSAEATAKYFFLGMLASALLLYGLSFLYGLAGATGLDAIHAALAGTRSPTGAGLVGAALVFVMAGLGFKVAAVPFHFYAPDVYQGTTHANASFLSIVPKAAGLIALVRLLAVAMPTAAPQSCRLLMLLAVLSMTVANLMALWQDNLRRLLAYSSIAHAGYLLLGLSVALAAGGQPMRWDALAGVLFYLVVYALATLGAFAALVYLGRPDEQIDHVDDLAGLARSHPAIAAALAVCLLSLTGVPPLAGFWGKLAVLAGALEVDPTSLGGDAVSRQWFIALAVVGALNAAVAAGYYLRVVGVIYFRLPRRVLQAGGGRAACAVALACALATIGVGLSSGPLWRIALDASQSVKMEAARPEASPERAPRSS